ncbi:MAG: aminotransferase class V-fold PLP-dependent enzyme [Planctomycetota bacterium]
MRMTEGPFPWPLPDADVQSALQAAYEDGSWGRYDGPHGSCLSDELRAHFASEHCLLCSSGTIGVELALRGCGVEAGDEVILAGYDFSGNFRAIEAIGAHPVLVDIDSDSWCLDADQLAAVERKRVSAVIVSHLHGGLAEMSKIMSIAAERGWHVVEDACQQPGARIGNFPVGSLGHVGVLSFGGSKLLTAGRGGAVLSNDAHVHQRMKVYSERGNWAFPMSELQAAVLRPQLAKLEVRNRQRELSVKKLMNLTTQLRDWLRPVVQPEGSQPAYYKLAWSLRLAESDSSIRDRLIEILRAAGVPIDVGFRGFTRRSKRRCARVGSLENSTRLSKSTLLLHHPVLLAHEEAVLQVANTLNHKVRQLAS